MPFADLTEPERLVWAAFPRGAWVDLREGRTEADDLERAVCWGPERVVRAEVLRALLLGAAEAEPGYAPGIRLRGARVTGRLDLMSASVAWPLVCEYCHFDGGIRVVEASVKTLRVVDSRVPAFNGTRMRLEGILNLWRCRIAGAVLLDQAKVTGQVCLRGAEIGTAGDGAEAVAAYGLAVDGGVDFHDLTAHGAVSVRAARITGPLDLSGAGISCPGRRALAADNAEIGGRLDGRGMTVDGETSMHDTRIAGSVILTGARLSNQAGQALSAGGMSAQGGVFLSGGFMALGEVWLVGATLAANLSLRGASLSNPSGVAVNLDRATIGVCHAEGLTCAGQFSAAGTRFASDLRLADAQLKAGDGNVALAADGVVVDGALALMGLRSCGEVTLRNAQIGRAVLMTGAVLENPRGYTACRLSGATIAGDVLCFHTTVTGGMRLTGARIGGRLSLDQVTLTRPAGAALSARALQAGQITLHPARPVEGTVDLSHARVEVFRDDPDSWPAELSLDGLTYQALEPRLPARQRLAWLSRDPGGYQSQPYEQLAAHYTSTGQPDQARAVLYASARLQRQAMSPLRRIWGLVQDVTLGYGYRPWRALAWAALLLAVGTVIFSISAPPALMPGATPHFNAFVYTLDLLLPVVDLGQKHAFNPAGAEQWFSYLLIAAGWILVTTVAAAAARVLTRR